MDDATFLAHVDVQLDVNNPVDTSRLLRIAQRLLARVAELEEKLDDPETIHKPRPLSEAPKKDGTEVELIRSPVTVTFNESTQYWLYDSGDPVYSEYEDCEFWIPISAKRGRGV